MCEFEWEPIELDVLLKHIDEEIVQFFGSEDHALWKRFNVEPRHHPICRSKAIGVEMVYVVAENGECLLFFDDVERDFAMTECGPSETIVSWVLFSALVAALRHLSGMDEIGMGGGPPIDPSTT